MKNNILIGLLMAGTTMFAGEPFLLKKSEKSEIEKVNPGLGIRYKTQRVALPMREWDMEELNSGGLFLNLGFHFPSTKFLNPYYKSGDVGYKMGFDFEFGNYFRFAKLGGGRMGIGLRATWLSLSYSSFEDKKDTYREVQICPVKIGPQFGLAINETMGIDAFYQIGFNFTDEFADIYSPGNSKTIGANAIYTGISHEIGAAFHYKVYSVGIGYRLGNLKMISYTYDGEALESEFLPDEKFSTNNFRVTLGFKF